METDGSDRLFDCIVVGGGPAGLSASLLLARYGRPALTFHNDAPRNACAQGIHGFLGHDGIRPQELLERGRSEVRQYGGRIIEHPVDNITGRKDDFTVVAGGSYRARTVLLATGVRDIMPGYSGFLNFYGTSIHHCPDCDGYEVRNKRVVVLGTGRAALALIQALRVWTPVLSLLTDGRNDELAEEERRKLATWGISVIVKKIAVLEGNTPRRQIESVRFTDGSVVRCDAMFFTLGTVLATGLHEGIGCRLDSESGLIWVGPDQQTSVPGVYAAGDLTPLSHMAVMAAAEGAMAAIQIHKSLLDDESEIG